MNSDGNGTRHRSASLQVVCEQGIAVRADDELVLDGWDRRFLGDEHRAHEAQALYLSLGFEVRLEHPRAEHFADQCEACASSCDSHVLVYTRKIGPTP